MNDSIQTEPQATESPEHAAQSLDRDALEERLENALSAGQEALPQQVRYVLAISQLNDVVPDNTPRPEAPLSVAEARVNTLEKVAHTLNETQIKSLIREAETIQNAAARIPLLARLALKLPPQEYRVVARDLWEQSQQVTQSQARAHVLFQLAPLLGVMQDEPGTSAALLDVVARAQAISDVEARMRSLIALAPYLPRSLSARLLQRVLDEVDNANNDLMRCNTILAMADNLPVDLEVRALRSAEAIKSPAERARGLTALARTMPPELQPRLRADALKAIATIQNEDERADALIAFAPHLEYASEHSHFPELLEQALALVIALSRRNIRVRVLAALAPNLTLDLQGEALAAVHSLSSERDRALLLAELAPTLPPEMLVASLAVAHTMREQDARVQALTTLAHYIPENAREQTLLDALAAASNLPHHFERVTALVSLVDILPPQLQEQAHTNALEAIRLIDNENAKSRALNHLGPHLPQSLLKRALNTAYELEDRQQRLNALIGLIPYLSDEAHGKAQEEMLGCTRAMSFEYKQARALVSIAPHLTPEAIQEAMIIADTLEDPFDRVSSYIALAQNSPKEQRPTIMGKAWVLIPRIDNGYDQASALAAIAPFLPPAGRGDMAVAAGRVIAAIHDEYDQASAISILAPLLAESDKTTFTPLPDKFTVIREGVKLALRVPQQHLRVQLLSEGIALWLELDTTDQRYRLWVEVAQHLQALPLADVLLCLGELVPVMRDLTDSQTFDQIIQVLGVR